MEIDCQRAWRSASFTFHHRGDDSRGIRGGMNPIDAKEARRLQLDTQFAVKRRYQKSGSQPLVTMMETANLWKGDYLALTDPPFGRLLAISGSRDPLAMMVGEPTALNWD